MLRHLKALLSLLLMLQAACLCAQSLDLYQYDHATWTDRDGVPSGITTLAQNTNGALWIGSEDGLYSFDGLAFTPFDPGGSEAKFFRGPVGGLTVTEENTLWVIFSDGGLASVTDHRVIFFDERSGLPKGRVTQVLQGPDHSILALSRDRVWQLRSGQWMDISDAIGLPKGPLVRAFVDSRDRLWIAAADRVWVIPKPGTKLVTVGSQAGSRLAITEGPDQSIWVQGAMHGPNSLTLEALQYPNPSSSLWRGIEMTVQTKGSGPPSIEDSNKTSFGGAHLQADKSGSIWSGTDYGLWKLRPALRGSAQNYSADIIASRSGLTGDWIVDLLQDLDGDIWVATENGLDRLRAPKFVPLLQHAQGDHFSLTLSPTGDMWFGSSDALAALGTVHGGTVTRIGPKRLTFSMYFDAEGILWFADGVGFWRSSMGSFRRFSAPPGVHPSEIRQIVGPNGADLFVLTMRDGVWHFQNGTWTRISPGLINGTPVSLLSDLHGQLWVGTSQGSIEFMDQDGHWSECLHGRPEAGSLTSMLSTNDGLLVASGQGLALVSNHGMRLLSSVGEPSLHDITAMLRTSNGDVWLNGTYGVARIWAEQLARAIRSSRALTQIENVSGRSVAGPYAVEPKAPSAVADAQGRMWFSTLHGIVSLDPSQNRHDSRLPIILPPSVVVDDRVVGQARSFSSDMHTLRIRYMGVHLSDPQRVTYRYRLNGVDPGWQEVGTTREAVYTGLHHGHYRFELMASNGDGSWSTASDYLEFDVRPTFYQTGWFRWLAGISTLLLGWAGLKTRDRYVSGQMRMRAEERAEERVRIARDLHDTLLQGVQGLMLRFHVASLSIPEKTSAREMLERTLISADALIIEGRNRISRLRSDSLAGISLNDALQTLCDQLNPDGEVQTLVKQDGGEIETRPLVKEELYSIAREALANSFSHARATQIEVTVAYGPRRLLLSCKDDGRGFVMTEGAIPIKANHWGLVGMCERASKIGAKLVFESNPGEGTSIVVSISARRAYLSQPMFQRWRSQP